jgi:hypothetical protein
LAGLYFAALIIGREDALRRKRDKTLKEYKIISIKDGSFFGFSESIEAPKVGASSFI